MSEHSESLKELMHREVVIDVGSQYVFLGTLIAADAFYLTLKEADVHDLRDTSTTRELYVVDARRHGIPWNRKQVMVRTHEIVSLSALEDVRI